MVFNIALGIIAYMVIGVFVAYMIASYYPKVNDRQDMSLIEFMKFSLVSAFLWPFLIWLMIYETYIEGRHLSRKIVIKYRGK